MVFVLDDPLVPLQLILKRRLVHGQVTTFTGELLEGLLGLLDVLPQGVNPLIKRLNVIVVTLLFVFDGLLQHSSLKGKTRCKMFIWELELFKRKM